MKILVCVKQVPDTETKIKLGGAGVDSAGVKWILNPYDEFAVEEALKIKAAKPETVVQVVTVGPKARAIEVLRTALAMGADDATVVDADESADNFSVAKALSEVAKKTGPYNIVLFGKSAIDDNNFCVGQMVAEFLDVPHVTSIGKADYTAEGALVEREVEGGAKEVIEVQFPVVLTANKGLNTPRYASLPGIMKAKKKTIQEMSLSDLGISQDAIKVKYTNYQLPAERPPVKMLSGDAAAQAQELAKLLREEAKVI